MSEKDGNQGGTGDYWLSYDSFPSKNYIDSAVYGDLPKKRECYQPLEIDFFFEFKSKEDFDAFRRNYHGNASPIKNKLSCCCWPFSIITIDSVGQITYDSLIIEK